MRIVRSQYIHSVIGNAPQIIEVYGSDPPCAPRTFVGTGAPSQTTLAAGNGKYNAGTSGFVCNVSLVNGGAAYKPGDELTEDAATGEGFNLQLTVKSVDANGAIIDWQIITVGEYSTYPTNPVGFTGGNGNGASFNLNFPAPDLYADITTPASPVVYICTAFGTNTSATWAKISGGGSGGYAGEYNLGTTYTSGQFVSKSTGANQGWWIVALGQTVAAGTNNLATVTIPPPSGGPWLLMAPMVVPVNTCAAIGGGTIYASATQSF